MKRAIGAIVLGPSACGCPLTQLAVRRWGVRGAAVAECVCVGVTGNWLPESPADRGQPMLRCAHGILGRSHISTCLPPSAKWWADPFAAGAGQFSRPERGDRGRPVDLGHVGAAVGDAEAVADEAAGEVAAVQEGGVRDQQPDPGFVRVEAGGAGQQRLPEV